MKKPVNPSPMEPVGIVITTGSSAPIEPLVRAYVWAEIADASFSRSDAKK